VGDSEKGAGRVERRVRVGVRWDEQEGKEGDGRKNGQGLVLG
jgi:hypothetical protein